MRGLEVGDLVLARPSMASLARPSPQPPVARLSSTVGRTPPFVASFSLHVAERADGVERSPLASRSSTVPSLAPRRSAGSMRTSAAMARMTSGLGAADLRAAGVAPGAHRGEQALHAAASLGDAPRRVAHRLVAREEL